MNSHVTYQPSNKPVPIYTIDYNTLQDMVEKKYTWNQEIVEWDLFSDG